MSKTTTYVVRLDNAEGFDARATDTKNYTHACVVGQPGEESAISWHTSAELAQRTADGWKGHGYPEARIVEAFARPGNKVTVVKRIKAELELAHMEANVPGVKELGDRLAAEAPAKAAKSKAAPSGKPSKVEGQVQLSEDLAETPGYRVHTRSRSSKTTAVLVDAEAQGLDTAKGRWVTVCADHGFAVAQPGQRVARDVLGHPETWCGPCGKAFKKSSKTA